MSGSREGRTLAHSRMGLGGLRFGRRMVGSHGLGRLGLMDHLGCHEVSGIVGSGGLLVAVVYWMARMVVGLMVVAWWMRMGRLGYRAVLVLVVGLMGSSMVAMHSVVGSMVEWAMMVDGSRLMRLIGGV